MNPKLPLKAVFPLWAVCFLACAVPAAVAQAPVVASLSRNGELVVTNLSPVSLSEVEWAPGVNGPWTNSWAGLVNLRPGTNGVVRVSVPLFYRVRVLQGVPTNMVLVPAGSFAMGDTLDGDSFALPVHTVDVGAFYMDRTEVTKAQWDEVYGWAVLNGYSFEFGAQGKGTNHPAQNMTWYDAVKWCNARSEKEGRVPAYYTNAALTGVYRTGQVNPSNDWVRWTGGYRLPTEAEWEKAARGGVAGQRFGFGNTIAHGQANYFSVTNYIFDVSPTRGFTPAYNDGVFPYTSPVRSFSPNAYGLHDMAGNVHEWCWDWSGSYSATSVTNPRGPVTGTDRVMRGGGWYFGDAWNCRSAGRFGNSPTSRNMYFGFRAVLPPTQP